MIKIGVVAETMAMRVGLREVINHFPEMTVVAAVSCQADMPREAPDVLVVVTPSDLNSLENDQAVLFLTDDSEETPGLPGQNISAWGLLPINASEAELNIAIQALAEGLWVGAPSLVQNYILRKQNPDLDETEFPAQALTGREIEVLQLAAQGLANKQIALKLGISEHTIKFHLSSLYAKFGISSRTEAVRAGVRQGLVVL